jgi:hypothetical protein
MSGDGLNLMRRASRFCQTSTGKTFLAEDLRKIGFTDTFNKRHWASRKELKHVLAKYKKELGPMAKTNTELERADDAVPVPEINSAK